MMKSPDIKGTFTSALEHQIPAIRDAMFAYKLCVVLVALLGADGEHQHGGKILGRMVRQYLHAQPDDVRIGDGVHLVSRAGDDARSLSDDGTVLGAVDTYLRSHELKIRLPELMPGDDLGRSFKMALDKVEGTGVESKFVVLLNGEGRTVFNINSKLKSCKLN